MRRRPAVGKADDIARSRQRGGTPRLLSVDHPHLADRTGDVLVAAFRRESQHAPRLVANGSNVNDGPALGVVERFQPGALQGPLDAGARIGSACLGIGAGVAPAWK
jgi:hypothetical protein